METRILSLNIGGPAEMHWEGRSVLSSMRKTPVAGPLIVHQEHIEGDSFASPQYHGTPYSVIYAFGLPSIHAYLKGLGIDRFSPGEIGETLTLEKFDESALSIGDVFQIGEVRAQVSFPRVPCAKLNFRFQHANAMKHMIDSGLCGVYFRILKPGRIALTDRVVLVEPAIHRVPFQDFFQKLMSKHAWSPAEFAHLEKNGAVPETRLKKLTRS